MSAFETAIAEVDLLGVPACGVILVTANERAARALRRGWDQQQRAAGRDRWEPLEAISWRAWCHALWRSRLVAGETDRLLLNATQEGRLWEAVLAESRGLKPDAALRMIAEERTEALAALCMEAYRRLRRYCGERRMRGATLLTGDPAIFARWMRAFEARCEAERLLPDAALEAELAQSMSADACGGRGLRLVGFDGLTPAQEALLQAWQKAGGTFEVQAAPLPVNVRLTEAPDEASEMRACAQWIRTVMEARPETRIAVVVADLESARDELEATLREVLAPELRDLFRGENRAVYEFSLGRKLATEPLVTAALDLLRWASGPLALERVTRLLLSPYFARGAIRDGEGSARAEMDAAGLRKDMRLRPEVAIAEVLRLAERDTDLTDRLPVLRKTLAHMGASQERLIQGRRGFGEWAEAFRRWLAEARWGGPANALSSREFQVHERWEDALDTLTTMDFLGERVSCDEALATVERLAREMIFAVEAGNAPVQVMGPMEAAGSRFDAVWVLRAGEQAWMPPTAAHPLLPRWLQRELGMPGLDMEVDRGRAWQMTQRLAGSAAEVIFSYSRVTEEGTKQGAAALVREVANGPVTMSEDLVAPQSPRPAIVLDQAEERGAFAPLPEGLHNGGVRLLQLQAACGFRAFAEMRLGAADLRERALGMDARERGSAVHDALQFFWSNVHSQAELLAMGQEQRREVIAQAVDHGLERASRRRVTPWDEAYVGAQRTRLVRLLGDWLDLEARRPPFTVLRREDQRAIRLGPLELSVRVDRTDLVDGKQVVIDYKTGKAAVTNWLGERPDEPQLPLYAVLTRSLAGDPQDDGESNDDLAPLGAVVYGEVRPGRDMKLSGLEQVPGQILSRRSPAKQRRMDAESLEAQVDWWETVLTRLATEFAAGDARVRPKQFPQSCEHCGQRLLCRVDASAFDPEEDDDGTDEDQEAGEHG